jgi:hypothetical protein
VSVDAVANTASPCVLAVGEDGRVHVWDMAAMPPGARTAAVPARCVVAFVAPATNPTTPAAARKGGKSARAPAAAGTAAPVRIPVVAARFLPAAAPGTAPRMLVARGSLVRPTFEVVVCATSGA